MQNSNANAEDKFFKSCSVFNRPITFLVTNSGLLSVHERSMLCTNVEFKIIISFPRILFNLGISTDGWGIAKILDRM